MENDYNWAYTYYEVLGRSDSYKYFDSEELSQAKEYVQKHKDEIPDELVICKRYQSSKEIKI